MSEKMKQAPEAAQKSAQESKESLIGRNFLIEQRPDGGYRLTHARDGSRAELPMNLPNYRSAVEVARMVEKVVILKETCANVNALHDRIVASGVCAAYAEGDSGMGSSLLKINDNGTVSMAKVREVRGDKPMAEGWRTKVDSVGTALQRMVGSDKHVYDGYEIRSALGNPDHGGKPGNPETSRILSASPENQGKTFAGIIAEFVNKIPLPASESETRLAKAR